MLRRPVLETLQAAVLRVDDAQAHARAFVAAYGTGTTAEQSDLLLQAYIFYLFALMPESEA